MENKKFAVLEGNNIINVIMAESQEIAESLFGPHCFEIDLLSSIDTEWKLNPETQEFYLPETEGAINGN
jgi:hypothetical protein